MKKNNERKKIYLHIGTPKTGTTAIQAFCYRNREQLEKDGFIYPVQICDERYGYGKYPQAGNAGEIAKMDSVDEMTDSIIRIIEDKNNVILSSEEFVHFCYDKFNIIIEQLLSKCAEIDIRVIAYIRNQADYFESFYRELVQEHNLQATINESYDYLIRGKTGLLCQRDISLLYNLKMSCDYYKWIQDIEKCINKQNIIIRNYEDVVKSNNDIVDDFFGSLGITIDNRYFREDYLANPSIGIELLEAKRIINSWSGNLYDETIRNIFMYELRSRVTEDYRHGKTSLLSNEQREAICEKYKKQNQLIARDYFDNADLFGVICEKEKEILDIKKYVDDAIRMLSGAILHASNECNIITKKLYEEYWSIERKRRSNYYIDHVISEEVDVQIVSNSLRKSQFVGWGAGKCCEDLIEFVNEFYPLKYVCDVNESKWGGMIGDGAIIISPSRLTSMKDVVIVIFSYEASLIESIKKEICNIGEYRCISACDWAAYVNRAD